MAAAVTAAAGITPGVEFAQTQRTKRVAGHFAMPDAGSNMGARQFEVVLSRERFKGLKAILDRLSSDREGQCEALNRATCYEDLLKRLGYRLVLIKQIHIQDAFSRMGRMGGIRDVLPYHDTSTQSSLPTLVNFDGTVSATPKSAAFFDELVFQLKTEGQTA